MGELENKVEGWIASVAGKKAIVFLAGLVAGKAATFLASSYLQDALKALTIVGLHVTVSIDQTVFQNWMVSFGGVGLVLAHDYLRLKFPLIKWL